MESSSARVSFNHAVNPNTTTLQTCWDTSPSSANVSLGFYASLLTQQPSPAARPTHYSFFSGHAGSRTFFQGRRGPTSGHSAGVVWIGGLAGAHRVPNPCRQVATRVPTERKPDAPHSAHTPLSRDLSFDRRSHAHPSTSENRIIISIQHPSLRVLMTASGVVSEELGTSKLFWGLVIILSITVCVLFAFRKPYLDCVEITKRRSKSRGATVDNEDRK